MRKNGNGLRVARCRDAGIYDTARRPRARVNTSATQSRVRPITEQAGVMAPEWCSLTVKRWNGEAKMVAEFPVQLLFDEVVARGW